MRIAGVIALDGLTITLDTNSGFSTIIDAGSTRPGGNITLSLPITTDTLVGRDTTDTLTSKSMSGSTNTFTNISLTTSVTGILPVANGGTGVSTFGAGIATWLSTPSSANLAAAVTDETGTGALVFASSPTLITPALGTPASAVLTNATGLPVATGISGLGAGIAAFLATPSSANLSTAITDETGTGLLVFATNPVLTTPNLGTPSAAVLTNATGLPISTGVSGLAANVATFLATPSSANLAAVLTDETGTGASVFASSPTLITPALGTPSAAVLTNATGLPLTTGVTGTLPVANGGTGITSFGAGIATWLGTPSSANLAAAITDETGTGALVFATSPTLVTPALGTPTAIVLTSATGLPLTTGVTGTLPIANGGTGQTAATAAFDALSPTGVKGDLIAHNGTSSIALAVGTNGQVLTADSAQPTGLSWTSSLTNPMTTLGDIIYGGASGATTRLAGNTTTTIKVLTQTGDGTNSAAPVWTTSTGTGSAVFSASPTFTGTVTLPTLVGTDATDSSSSTTGAFKTAGGLGVAKTLWAGSLGASSAHTLQSSINIPFVVSSGASSCYIQTSHSSGTAGFKLGSTTISAYSFLNGSGTEIGNTSIAGAWTFPIATNHKFGSDTGAAQTQVIIDAAAGQGRAFVINQAGGMRARFRVDSSNVTWLTTNAASLNFSTDAETTNHGSISTAGAWTFGPASSSGTHTVNGVLSISAASAYISGQSQIVGNPSSTSVINGGTKDFGLGTNSGGMVFVEDSSGQEPMAIYFFNRTGATALIASNAGFTSNWSVSNPTNGFITFTNISGGTLSIKGFVIGMT